MQSHEKPRVGVVGLGRMGQPMAVNLARAGFTATVYNRTAERCRPAEEAGARVAGTPREVAESCDVLITMLADEAAIDSVLGGPDGALAGAREGQVFVETSTIGPFAVRRFAERVAEAGAEMVDSPVSGSIPQATEATLLAMVGGPAETFERVRPVLEALSSRQLHLGPLGSGAAMKLVVNGILGVTNLALSEGLVLAERAGIDPELAYEVIDSSAIASPFVHYKREAFKDPASVEVFISSELIKRDLGLAIELARSVRAPLFGVATANEAMTMLSAAGHDKDDLAWLANVLRDLGGGPGESAVGDSG